MELFCSKCGEPLDHYYSRAGHSKETGEKLYRLRLRCPKARWWNRHDCYVKRHHYYRYRMEYTMLEINHFLASHKDVMLQITEAWHK